MWQRVLSAADARQAAALEEAIVKHGKAGRFDEAEKSAQAVVQLRERAQGPAHWQAVDARWEVVAWQRAGKAKKANRQEYRRLEFLGLEAVGLYRQGQYGKAQPLFEKLLAIRRTVLGEDHPDTAAGYSIVGLTLNAQAKYALAQPLCEKALAIHRKVLGEEHPATAGSYSSVALNLNAQGKYALAQALYEKALAIHRKVQGEEHPHTAAGYSTVGFTLNAQGKYALAQPLFEKALTIHRKVLGEGNPHTAKSYNNLAANLAAQGKYASAQSLCEKALVIYRKVFGEEHPDTASIYENLAANLNAQGKYARVQPLLQKALAIRRKVFGEEHPDTARSYDNAAGALSAQGKYALVQPLCEKALAIYRKVLGEEHPDTAFSYIRVAANLNAQGKYAVAQPVCEKALAIHRKVLGEEHPDTARSYIVVALNLHDQGKYVVAQPLNKKAVAIFRKVFGEDHPETATSYDNLAVNLNAQGKYALAHPLHEQALTIRRKVLGEDHPDTATSYDNVAVNLNAQGKHALAQPLYEKALGISCKVLGEKHPDTAICYTNLAFNLHAQGKSGQAERFATRAAASFDRARLRLASPGFERAAKTGERSPLPLLAALLAASGKTDLAWQRYEQSLARGTGEELATRLRWPTADRDRLTALRARLSRLDRLIEQTLSAKGGVAQEKERREGLLGRRLAAQEKLETFRKEMEKRHGVAAGQVFDRAAIQKALPADTALLGWLDVGKDHWAVLLRATGDPVCVRLHGSGDKRAWTAADDTLPRRLRAALVAGDGKWEDLSRRLRRQRLEPLAEHLKGVRRLVVLPSPAMDGVPVEVIAGGRTVSYAASGTLVAHLRGLRPSRNTDLLALADPIFERPSAPIVDPPLPTGGLLVTMVGPGSNAARAGLKAGDVLLQYAGTDLKSLDQLGKLLRARAKHDTPALKFWRDGKAATRPIRPGALGIVLDRRPAREALAERYKNDKLLAATRSGDDGKWQALLGTRVEVEALHKLLGGKGVTLLTDSQASQQKLDELASKGALSRYRFLHLATHGTADWRMPLHSALILSRDRLPNPFQQLEAGKPVYDGRLTAEEVLSKWQLDADLVTLSACQTALGKHERGEGFLGFAQAFILAGSRSVVLSLWKVDDGATALLMQRFYANLLGKRHGLKKPLPKAEALAEAKSWLRGLSREEALARWAGVQGGVARGKGRKKRPLLPAVPKAADKPDRPYAHPYYWAAFILVGRPD
jgi:hypothetical protein